MLNNSDLHMTLYNIETLLDFACDLSNLSRCM